MRNRNIIILTLIVVLLGGFAFFTNKNEKISKENQYENIDFKVYRQITIERPRLVLDQKISIQFEDQKSNPQLSSSRWLIRIFPDLGYSVSADQNFIQTVVDKISELKLEKVNVGDEEAQSKFNFDDPFLKILIEGDSTQLNLKISERTNFEGKHYARIEKNHQIVLVDSEVVNLANKEAIFFQDKHPLLSEINKVKNIEMDKKVIKEKDKVHFLDQISKMTVQKYIPESEFKIGPHPKVIKIFKDSQSVDLTLDLADKLYGKIKLNNQNVYVLFDMTYWAFFANYFIEDKK